MAKQQLTGRVGNSRLVVFNKYALEGIRLTDNLLTCQQSARLPVLLP